MGCYDGVPVELNCEVLMQKAALWEGLTRSSGFVISKQ